MTNNKKIISLISLIFFILVGITIWLIYYSLDNNRNILTPFPEGTELGYIYIGGKTSSQAENAINESINKWKNAENLKIVLTYQDGAYTINVDKNIFAFDVHKSIQNVKNRQKMDYEKGINVIIVDFNEDNESYIDNLLSEHYSNLKFSDFNVDIIKKELLKYVSFLYKEIYIDLGLSINKESAKLNKVGPAITINTNGNLINKINKFFLEPIEIKGKTQFSLNQYLIEQFIKEKNLLKDLEIDDISSINDINDIDENYLTRDELNRVATGIYQTILDTNFVNIQKEISYKLPAYAQAGLEAAIKIEYDYIIENDLLKEVHYFSQEDLSFYNPNQHSYYIEIKAVNNTLVFQLYGPQFINTYSHSYKQYNVINFAEIIKTGSGQNEVGYPGYYSILQRTTKYPDNTEITTIITEDIYNKKDAITYVDNQDD